MLCFHENTIGLVMLVFVGILIATLATLSVLVPLEPQTFVAAPSDPPVCGVAIALMMRNPVDLPLWLKHHRNLGVRCFFIRLEDSPSWIDFLESQPDVVLEVSRSDEKNNYETIMHRQLRFVDKSLARAAAMGGDIEWVFHVDADELLYGSLAFLDMVDPSYKVVTIKNVEAIFDGKEESCFSARKFVVCEQSTECRAYANGKSGGRVGPGISLMGPHNFGFNGQMHGSATYDVPIKQLCVLHFDGCSFGAWAEKFRHLSTGNTSSIPFSYYNDSIKAATTAFDAYKKHVIRDSNNVPAHALMSI